MKVKIFVTGDNHFGKKYDRYQDIKSILIESRFDALKRMIAKAEAEGCELFVVTGDLFDSINTAKSEVEKAVKILGSFSGTVLILPGNHDYYTGSEKVWNYYDKVSQNYPNIVLLNELKTYDFDIDEENVVIYPAFCNSKHSEENRLGWIKNTDIDTNKINIGIAHGAIKGLTPDNNNEYFLMTETELNDIGVDAWLIGHTHVPYPRDLKESSDTVGHKIFNAGTHEQTDLANNTEGLGFIITIEKSDGKAKVSARKYISGRVRYYNVDISLSPADDIEKTLKKAVSEYDKNSVIRANIRGRVKPSEYEDRGSVYEKIGKVFLAFETDDDELSEEITTEKIRSEFAETSFTAHFLEEIDDPVELQMAYELVKELRGEE